MNNFTQDSVKKCKEIFERIANNFNLDYILNITASPIIVQVITKPNISNEPFTGENEECIGVRKLYFDPL